MKSFYRDCIWLIILMSLFVNKIYCNDLIKVDKDIDQNEICDSKIAVVFGITGQDGCYLTKLLLNKGYKIYGITRKATASNTQKLFEFIKDVDIELKENLILLNGDITDHSFVSETIRKYMPDEIYNLAAQSSVKTSFEEPLHTLMVDAVGTLNILVSMHSVDQEKKIRFYQASTCEVFGKTKKFPQDELTPFYPRSPYGVAKACAYWSTINYREAYNMYACNGILFNHESPFRGEEFVTRIITKSVSKIKKGEAKYLSLGNLNAKRDWGFAGDYVEAMWLMLQQDKPEDYVIATGEVHSVREFVELAFNEIGIDIIWRGHGVNEVGIDKKTGQKLIYVDPKYFRPTEVDFLIGDPSKAKNQLKWKPRVSFKELVKMMIKNDINLLK
ncbi:MAG: GDP-mannose 4,6-dehydratase [Candidatus Babeliales bacterium]|nr:GDP-mannose 4,6-dehydratase [Candidatus Babeliales bacterium]